MFLLACSHLSSFPSCKPHSVLKKLKSYKHQHWGQDFIAWRDERSFLTALTEAIIVNLSSKGLKGKCLFFLAQVFLHMKTFFPLVKCSKPERQGKRAQLLFSVLAFEFHLQYLHWACLDMSFFFFLSFPCSSRARTFRCCISSTLGEKTN